MPNPMDPAQPQRPGPEYPKSPEQPVVPPDDPNRPDVDREPNIDPPPTVPPMEAPSEKPVITEPPSPRAQPPAHADRFPRPLVVCVDCRRRRSPSRRCRRSRGPTTSPCSCAMARWCGARSRISKAARSTCACSRDDQRRLPIGEVALIDRVGGASGLPETELREARRPEHLAFLTSGGSVTGKLVDIAGGPGSAAGEEDKERRFIFQLPDGSQRSVPGNDVGRVYLGSYSLQGGDPRRRRPTRRRRPAPFACRPTASGSRLRTASVADSGSASTSAARSVSRSTPRTWRRPRAARAWRPKPRCPNAPAGALIGRIGEDGGPFPDRQPARGPDARTRARST